MQPYFTLLKDSFREAFATKTLTFTLLAITLFLLVLLPIGLTQGVKTTIALEEFVDLESFLETIYNESLNEEPSVGKHLWEQFSSQLRTQATTVLTDDEKSADNRLTRGFRSELNQQLSSKSFYNAEAWQDIDLGRELTADIEAATEGSTELRAANREALEVAYPRQLDLSMDGAIYFSYFGYRPFQTALPFPPDRQDMVINTAIQVLITVLMGIFGILISILVTASIMPRTFEPGEITLLLSKPISRAGLFLTRFLGGCTFTLVNAAYMIVGIWLIVGVKFGLWNEKLLWCIPVYLFAFSIYYVVSATAGAIWRNAILAICMTIAFWVALFVLGLAKNTTEQLAVESSRIREIIPAGDTMLVIDGGRDVLAWNDNKNSWENVFRIRSSGGPPAFARRMGMRAQRFLPRYDELNERIIAIEPSMGRRRSSRNVITGERAKDWKRESAGIAPEEIDDIFLDSKGRTILVAKRNIFEFRGQDARTVKMQSWLKNVGADFLAGGGDKSFRPLLTDHQHRGWSAPFSVSMLNSTNELAVYSDGVVELLSQNDEGEFTFVNSRDLESSQPSLIALGEGKILLAAEEAGIEILDGDTLEQVDQFKPFKSAPRSAVASPNGRWLAVLSHEGELFLYDTQLSKPVDPDLTLDRASGIAFSKQNSLLIADRISRLRSWEIRDDGLKLNDTHWSSDLTLTQTVFRAAIRPVYACLPKPSELDNVVQWLTTDQTIAPIGDGGGNNALQQDRIQLKIWEPIQTNLIFVLVVLALGCFKVSRQDF